MTQITCNGKHTATRAPHHPAFETYKPYDLHGLKTYDLSSRPSKVFHDDLGRPAEPGTTVEDWLAGLPRQLAANDVRRTAAHIGRAFRDGRDEEYVVCALLHDIGDTLGSYNHPDIAAAILKPFVSAENLWMVEKHGVFQGYYFFHHLGMDRHLREQFKEHPQFQATAEFCAKYDAAAFDPEYDTLPLSFFEPMMERLFAQPKNSIYQAAMEEHTKA